MDEEFASKHMELHAATRSTKRLKTEAKGSKTCSQSKSSSSEMEETETVEDLTNKAVKALEDTMELTSTLEKVVRLLMDLQEKTFNAQQERLRTLRILSSGRDFVSRFRFKVFHNVRCHHREVAEKYMNLGSFMHAMHQEINDYRSKRIAETPLYDKYIESVQRLGLSTEEWRLVRDFGAESVEELHNPFSVEQLEAEVFPARLEKYRAPLLKVAKKLQELEGGPCVQFLV